MESTDIAIIKEQVFQLRKDTDENCKEIKELQTQYNDLSKDVAKIMLNTEYTKHEVSQVSSKLDKLTYNNFAEHYEKPIKKKDKLIDLVTESIIKIITYGVLGYLLIKLFPFIQW